MKRICVLFWRQWRITEKPIIKLIASPANIDLATDEQGTPYTAAIISGNMNFVMQLFATRAKSNLKILKNEETAIILVSEYEYEKI